MSYFVPEPAVRQIGLEGDFAAILAVRVSPPVLPRTAVSDVQLAAKLKESDIQRLKTAHLRSRRRSRLIC